MSILESAASTKAIQHQATGVALDQSSGNVEDFAQATICIAAMRPSGNKSG
jgi:hypothetical protein